MLSRSAQSLYWIGRHLERAGHLCQLLRLQSEALVDRPVREIHFGWNRIYNSIDTQPPGGRADLFDEEEFALADSFTLADDLTFERTKSFLGLHLLCPRTRKRPPHPALHQSRGVDLPQHRVPEVTAAEHGQRLVGPKGLLRRNRGRNQHLRRSGRDYDVPR